jgi:hypothetical protein
VTPTGAAADRILVSTGLAVNAGVKQISKLRACVECYGESATEAAIFEAQKHKASMPIEYASTVLSRKKGEKAAEKRALQKTIGRKTQVYE